MGVRMALAAAAIAVSAAGGANAQMEEWARWQVVDGVATIQNDAAAFGVTCGEGGGPAVTLTAPDAAAIPESATVLIQVSNRSDAYVLEDGTEIETFLRHFRPAAGGGYTSDEDPIAPLVDSLRAGVNLIVAVEVFDRSQRFTLAGSSRAIETALADCGG
ncbi:MAG: hypothetical protein H6843_05005 [Rhodospirillaceae bacterium]|nr:hypothetical protein [Rhodospirillaceae bacterium]